MQISHTDTNVRSCRERRFDTWACQYKSAKNDYECRENLLVYRSVIFFKKTTDADYFSDWKCFQSNTVVSQGPIFAPAYDSLFLH